MKEVRGKLYSHKSTIGDLTSQQKTIIKKAINLMKTSSQWNLIRLDSENKICFLYYPDFDQDPHPKLQHSFSVNLTTKEAKFRDSYKNNPPILHRKETFVNPDFPNYDKFSYLTKQEEKAGLLDPSISHRIGFKKQWEELLNRRGFKIINHELLPVNYHNAIS